MRIDIKSLLFGAVLSSTVFAGAALAQPGAQTAFRVLINPGDSGEQSRTEVYGVWKVALEQALRKERITNVLVSLSNDTTADLGATRSRTQDIFVAPAHVIGSAVRYGYAPVLGLEQPVQAVLVAPQGGSVTTLAQAAGKRLGLPMQDSVVTYLLRGEVNAANTTVKRHFGELYQTRYQDALLLCLQLQRCDVVAVERAVFDRWIAAGESLRVVLESKPVPGLSVALKPGVRPEGLDLFTGLSQALQQDGTRQTASARLVAQKTANFDYVSTLGYFTPREQPGATVVDANTVTEMLKRGANYIDTRTDTEFKAGRVPGSRLVPYVEKSPKEADFDPKLDQFDLSKLPQQRDAELIFACNGAECWKSFKASHAAVKAGYTKVHWFRGGFPEWRAAGQKIESGG